MNRGSRNRVRIGTYNRSAIAAARTKLLNSFGIRSHETTDANQLAAKSTTAQAGRAVVPVSGE